MNSMNWMVFRKLLDWNFRFAIKSIFCNLIVPWPGGYGEDSICILKNNTNLNWNLFCFMKSSEIVFIFTCILSDYVAYEVIKDFWKINHFENVTAVFVLRCQISLRQEICLTYFIDSWKQILLFKICKGPQKWL